MRSILLSGALLLVLQTASAHEDATAHYLANEGLMAAHGDTKILFDPLFSQSYGNYRLVPPDMRSALFAGEQPWDGIDAVFISHYHGDHFAPADMLEFLRKQESIHLYAPEQAVAAMRAIGADDDALFSRVTAINLQYGDKPLQLRAPGLLIEVVRLPHSGWPDSRVEVENLAWRVTLDDGPTVLHLGDADTSELHFSPDSDYWRQRKPDMAFPPYWYFLSESGQAVLREYIRPKAAVGVHVPVNIQSEPSQRADGLQEVDLFTVPGETRTISHDH